MTIKYGIIGAGRMGSHHANQLMQMSEAYIVAVCDSDEKIANNLGNRTNAKVYTDYHKMLEEESLDAVYLCTPVRGRLEQVEAITSKKVNLYIEKPLAVSIEEGEKIQTLVRKSGIFCTVGFQWRSMDIVKKAKEVIGDDPISLITGRYYWTVPLVKWIQQRHLGGGQVFDQNIHMVDLAIYFAGEVDHLYSVFTQKVTTKEMENWDGYSSTVSFKNNTVGNFYSTYGLYPEIDEKPFLDIIQKNRLVRITEGQLIIKTPGKEEKLMNEDRIAGINYDFHQALLKKDKSYILASIEDGFHTLKVVLGANCSAVQNKIIDIADLNSFGLEDLKKLNVKENVK
ncbi:Gfo/Idh/MocA family protein [Aquibacillus albus]|uniref:Dehydrogenase n=1 Tax=Aquibacillus albus TaxID=1168171 RepID=A0ABS2N3J0_9BACI|nr:Gfo/Idh/MocA family oxidoreductase [Aquibacillus albus]MBM7572674.1 putative dehydrogenase [Aquibacillus albus]